MDQFEEQNQQPQPQVSTKGNFGWAVLGFFFQLVGLILFLVWRNDRSGDAKCAGIGALVGFLTSILGGILFVFCFAGMAGLSAGMAGLGAVTLL